MLRSWRLELHDVSNDGEIRRDNEYDIRKISVLATNVFATRPMLHIVGREVHVVVKTAFDALIYLDICSKNQAPMPLLNERQPFHSCLAIQ